MTDTIPGRLDAFRRFGAAMLTSRDIDPAYPVLAHVATDADDEARQWLCYLHLAFYDLSSAVTVWLDHPHPTRDLPDLVDQLPCGIERRSLRGGRVRAHLQLVLDFADASGGFDQWLTATLTGDPIVDWLHLTARIEAVPGNGRWAGYKAGDLWRYIAGYDVEPFGIGAADATGPRDGLTSVYPFDYATVRRADWIDRCEGLATELLGHLHAADVPAGIDQVETMLCDFHSLTLGRYYVGHDIDQQLEQTGHHGSADATTAIMAARHATLPHPYLGELGGWPGVDRPRRRAYIDTGEVLER